MRVLSHCHDTAFHSGRGQGREQGPWRALPFLKLATKKPHEGFNDTPWPPHCWGPAVPPVQDQRVWSSCSARWTPVSELALPNLQLPRGLASGAGRAPAVAELEHLLVSLRQRAAARVRQEEREEGTRRKWSTVESLRGRTRMLGGNPGYPPQRACAARLRRKYSLIQWSDVTTWPVFAGPAFGCS